MNINTSMEKLQIYCASNFSSDHLQVHSCYADSIVDFYHT